MSSREHISTILVATLFSVLIWLWAEGENLESQVMNVTVRFEQRGSENFIVRARRPDDPENLYQELSVRLDLEGPNLKLQRVLSSSEKQVIYIDVAAEPGQGQIIGDRDIDLVSAIQRLPIMTESGITVKTAFPTLATIKIDELVLTSIVINTDIPGFEFENIVVTPKQIDVLMPQDQWLHVQRTVGSNFVLLDLPVEDIRSATPGTPTIFDDVGLIWDSQLLTELGTGIETVTMDDITVKVELTVGSRVGEFTLATVPVRIGTPPRDEKNYIVELVNPQDEVIQDVIISGDQATIERLKDPNDTNYRVSAIISLSSDELEQGITSKRIDWVLPRGLSARMKDGLPDDRPVINIKITKLQQEIP